MHTEHLQNVRPPIVASAWLIAVGTASLLMMIPIGLNFVDAESADGTRVAIAAVSLGFFAGGLFAGSRAATAPILHGVFIGLVSLFVWFVLNVVMTIILPGASWQGLTPNLAVALVLLMIVSAVLGARAGYRRIKAP